MNSCESIYQEHQINDTFDSAVDNYLRATEQNDGLALLRYKRATVKLAKLTGERLAEVEAEVIACATTLVAMR